MRPSCSSGLSTDRGPSPNVPAVAAAVFYSVRYFRFSFRIPLMPSLSLASLVHRVRILFRIAVFNFVIPTLFSIVQLIISFQNVFSVYVGDVIYVNGMVSVYGVVFASVWAGKESLRNWKEAKQYWEHNNNNQSRHNRHMMEGDDNVEVVGEAWKEAGCSRSESAAVIRQTVAVDDSQSEVLDSTLEEAEGGRDCLDLHHLSLTSSVSQVLRASRATTVSSYPSDSNHVVVWIRVFQDTHSPEKLGTPSIC
jgi:hypothetical protein